MAQRPRNPGSRPRPASRPRAAARPQPGDLRGRIVQETLRLADEIGWQRVRLRTVAERLGIGLTELFAEFRDLDAVADAWLRRGVEAMLAPPPAGFAEMPATERLFIVMMRFFDALAAHRRVTAQIVQAKLYPSHPHHWAPLVFNLSRTVQWVREAALLDAAGLRRQSEEIGLTALFVAVFGTWARDRSPGQERTRNELHRRLRCGDRIMVRLWGRRPPPGFQAA